MWSLVRMLIDALIRLEQKCKFFRASAHAINGVGYSDRGKRVLPDLIASSLTTEEQMKAPRSFSSKDQTGARSGQYAGARIIGLVMVALALGLAGGAYFYYRHVKREMPAINDQPAGVRLSDATQTILQGLDSPVDITFYAPSDFAALPQALGDFATRAQQLLSEYERVGQGKIRVIQSDPASSNSSRVAANAAGVLPFAGNNGSICYLGITIARGNQKETMPQLSPDWEAALESDLSRAIARVSTSMATPALPVAQVSGIAAPIDPAISEELVRSIPNLDSRSFADAAQILREASMAEFTAAVREMQTKVQETQKELTAQHNKSDADQQAATRQLQEVQTEQSKKLNEITARLQARIAVLERLKGVNRSTPK